MDLVSIQCCSNSVSNWGIKQVIVTISLTKVFGRTVLGERTSDQISSREWSTVIDKGDSASNNQPPRNISFQVHICTNKKYSLLKGHGMNPKSCGLKAFVITVADQLNIQLPHKAVTEKTVSHIWKPKKEVGICNCKWCSWSIYGTPKILALFPKGGWQVENSTGKGKQKGRFSGYFATFWKQKTEKKTHTCSQQNEQKKKKPETQVHVSICQGEGEIGNTSHHL